MESLMMNEAEFNTEELAAYLEQSMDIDDLQED